jgi:Fur family ferric uptake transcriptional regulator
MNRSLTEHGHGHRLPTSTVLRERGRRLTVQRAAIWDVLVSAPDMHLSAEELAERVRERLPQVNASTVYRTLDTLVDEGLVLRADFGTGRAVFEPAHEHPHHHLVCERCGSVTHIHDEELGSLGERLQDRFGFRLSDRETTLFGVCRRCPSSPPTEREAYP